MPVEHYREAAKPATDYYTWKRTSEAGRITVQWLEKMLSDARAEGVPDDAALQIGGNMIYIHWHRVV